MSRTPTVVRQLPSATTADPAYLGDRRARRPTTYTHVIAQSIGERNRWRRQYDDAKRAGPFGNSDLGPVHIDEGGQQ